MAPSTLALLSGTDPPRTAATVSRCAVVVRPAAEGKALPPGAARGITLSQQGALPFRTQGLCHTLGQTVDYKVFLLSWYSIGTAVALVRYALGSMAKYLSEVVPRSFLVRVCYRVASAAAS